LRRNLELVGQQALVNKKDFVAPRVESDRPIRAGAMVYGHVHAAGNETGAKGAQGILG
jgi:hypothetical protein